MIQKITVNFKEAVADLNVPGMIIVCWEFFVFAFEMKEKVNLGISTKYVNLMFLFKNFWIHICDLLHYYVHTTRPRSIQRLQNPPTRYNKAH